MIKLLEKLLILFFLLTGFKAVDAQKFLSIKGEVPVWAGQLLIVKGFDDAGMIPVDSMEVDGEGKFRLGIKGEDGIYRLNCGKDYLDVMLTSLGVDFKVEGDITKGEVSFKRSGENNLYHYYRNELKHLARSIQAVKTRMDALPFKSAEARELKKEYLALQKERKQFIKSLWFDHQDSWSARMAVGEIDIVPGIDVKMDESLENIQKHFFDYMDFTDSILMKSTIFFHKIEQFLKVSHMEEKIFMGNWEAVQQVIDQLYYEAEVEPLSQVKMSNFLFQKYPYDKYFETYHRIAESFKLQNSCEYVMANRVIRERIQNLREMHKATTIPDLPLRNMDNFAYQNVSDIGADATLLVIWSGNCPHSNEILDQLRSLYEKYQGKGFEIVAVAIDNNKSYWEQTVEEKGYSWINACDLDGLKGETAQLFNVYTTPSMFLFDAELHLLDIPLTYYQVAKRVEKIFPLEL